MTYTARINDRGVEDIVEFVRSYFSLSDDDIRSIVERHLKYKTIDVLYEGQKIIGVVRYNIVDDGKVARILDLIIKDGGVKVIKYFIARGWMRFPSLEEIHFVRNWKYPQRDDRVYKIHKFFKGGR